MEVISPDPIQRGKSHEKYLDFQKGVEHMPCLWSYLQMEKIKISLASEMRIR